MTFLGISLIAIGLIGLFAGLIGLALARYGGQRIRGYNAISLGRAAILASAAAPLMVLGFVISDARPIWDPVGMVLVTVIFLAVIVAFCLPVVARARGYGSTIKATI